MLILKERLIMIVNMLMPNCDKNQRQTVPDDHILAVKWLTSNKVYMPDESFPQGHLAKTGRNSGRNSFKSFKGSPSRVSNFQGFSSLKSSRSTLLEWKTVMQCSVITVRISRNLPSNYTLMNAKIPAALG